ncbi:MULTISPECIES: hypothetical protein [Burkholderia]|uniref:hypothetical protein n=1 Tax=Burkholderia TaxID=32008 RepID=UPI00018E2C49|nr:hypothetical protein [Burkholderia multivorans]EEE02103.1 hypothetical protein BURMUCGD1_5421 [Burkholderia multivorans CGD1]KVT47797.1 hypothetical protein WK52_07240 [Burkholderia multivorans]MBR8016944.1 hypothetical protein [Burkholderia multivorans]MBR8241572.1 hypothetical protein [Burkholderia multivorans]MBU9280798.1 hypothetical protein [Burkholderia multivorans]
MTKKHCPIAGFRIAKPVARRNRAMNENRPIRLSEIRQLIGELVASGRRDDGGMPAALMPAAGHGVSRPDTPPVLPQRKVFDVARIDRSKSTLRVITLAEAKARGRRETLAHFGLDPDL